MSGGDHALFIAAAYGVTLVLLAIEVWSLVRRSRVQAAALERKHDNEA